MNSFGELVSDQGVTAMDPLLILAVLLLIAAAAPRYGVDSRRDMRGRSSSASPFSAPFDDRGAAERGWPVR